MADIYEIVRGIKQAEMNAKDHPYGGSEPPLDRAEGHKIVDSRVNDGFKVAVGGNILGILYHSEIPIERAHDVNFESDMEKRIKEIASFLKKEYKTITGNTLSLSQKGEVHVLTQSVSNVRTYVQAKAYYEIKGIDSMEDEEGEERERVYDDIDDMLSEQKESKEDVREFHEIAKKFLNG